MFLVQLYYIVRNPVNFVKEIIGQPFPLNMRNIIRFFSFVVELANCFLLVEIILWHWIAWSKVVFKFDLEA